MKLLKLELQNFYSRYKIALISLLCGVLLSLIILSFPMNLFEAILYDFRVKLSSIVQNPNPQKLHSAIVSIDDSTIEKLNEQPPLSLKTHIEIIKKVSQYNPKAIALFIDYNENFDSSLANNFVQEAEKIISNGIPIFIATEIDATGEILPPYPISVLPHLSAVIHKDGNTYAEDKVTRRAFYSIDNSPSLHLELAKIFAPNLNLTDNLPKGVYEVEELLSKLFLINYISSTKKQSHKFYEISASHLLENKAPSEALKNKIVLIGTKLKEQPSDYTFTPFSKKPLTNPKLIVHANIIETLIRNNAITYAGPISDYVITLILTALSIGLVLSSSPAQGVLATLLGSIILLAIGILSFIFFNFAINLAHPLVGFIAAYYIFVPYRLIMEYKKRWDIQKKHEILVQVEELKSNFMSLITHDLKTPVARIQGLAEILSHTLVSKDPQSEKLISEILSSTEELNHFISSILELARIESNRIQVLRHSKDINKLIEDTVRKLEFTAKNKSIKITLNLEPLFPILLDSALITKVISNLIDNAIKYSPENSEIIITTKESETHPGFIEIKIKDTGYGIDQKDLENLFSKFYRAKNDHTMKVKGTGLGLYLSRYFIDLHGGDITVTSKLGEGTEFTILLPESDEAFNLTSSNSKNSFRFLTRKIFGQNSNNLNKNEHNINPRKEN